MVRKHYTPELANRSLPLVRAITADVQQTACAIQQVAIRMRDAAGATLERLQQDLDRLREHFAGLCAELDQLGIELKDPLTGLIDFRARRQGQEVYLCWRLGEDAVGHWHRLDAGVAGRRPLDEY